ncbi:hypothetical protein ABID30_003635 [Enterococcus rotai]|uniref:hypothetical protein n=1 Tax=Enterococcus rotai TaxID=118060 RepID=UPI00339658CA
MKNTNKFFQNSLFILIPAISSLLISFLFNSPFYFIAGALYALLLLFMLPSFDFGFLDFNAKQINPSFKSEKKIDEHQHILPSILVLLALITCIFLLYFEYKLKY